MSNAKKEHTLGPWEVYLVSYGPGVQRMIGPRRGEGKGYRPVARVMSGIGEPADGNARLIAAAPEMLSALRAVEQQFKSAPFEGGPYHRLIRAAIESATGTSATSARVVDRRTGEPA